MTANTPVLLRLLSSAVSVASRAGAEVRRISKSGHLGVVDKGTQDFQTESDRTAQRMIVASLSKKFPSIVIIGEEDLKDDKKADSELVVETEDESVLTKQVPPVFRDIEEKDITLFVDPLDGTAEYVKGFVEHITILIGIAVGGRSIAGIIHQPFHGQGRTIWALSGLGCFGLEAKPKISDRLVVTTTSSHGNRGIEDTLAAIKPDEVMRVGGAGNKVLMVLEGKASCYLFPSTGCKRWDTSAAEAILEANGAVMTDIDGKPIDYTPRPDGDYTNHFGVIVSRDMELHQRILSEIPAKTKEFLIDQESLRLKSKY